MISVFVLIFAALNIFLRYFIAVQLWGWFITPIFGLPMITWVQAFGIGLTFTALFQRVKRDPTPTEKPTPRDDLIWHIGLTTGWLMIWLIGWLIA